MKQIQKIMVAVDLSDYSLPSVQYAYQLAKDLNAFIVLINVLNVRDVRAIQSALQAHDPDMCQKAIDEHLEARREKLRMLAVKSGAKDTVVKKTVRVGEPYHELLAAIAKEKPDLLVMGTKGRGSLADVIVGSCAQKMFHMCPIPMLSIRPGAAV